MATTTASNGAKDLASGLDESAEKIGALNAKLVDSAKKAGTASLNAYDKALATVVALQEQAAGATRVDWVTTVIKAQTSYLTEVSTAYTRAAREALK